MIAVFRSSAIGFVGNVDRQMIAKLKPKLSPIVRDRICWKPTFVILGLRQNVFCAIANDRILFKARSIRSGFFFGKCDRSEFPTKQ